MRIGLFVGSVGAAKDLQGQVDQVADAESDGFDSFWLAQVDGLDPLTFIALGGKRLAVSRWGLRQSPSFPLAMMARPP